MDDQGASDRKSDAKASNSCCRPPNSGDDRPARPPSGPRRSPDGWSEVVTPCSWAAPPRAGPLIRPPGAHRTPPARTAGGARSPLQPRAHHRPQTGAAWPIPWPPPSTPPEESSSRRRSPLASPKGPSITMRSPAENLTRTPSALQRSAARSRSRPALDSALLYLPIWARNSSLGRWPGSRSPLISIITRTSCLLPAYLDLGRRRVRTQALPGRRIRVGEIDRASEPGLAGRRAAHVVAKRDGYKPRGPGAAHLRRRGGPPSA